MMSINPQSISYRLEYNHSMLTRITKPWVEQLCIIKPIKVTTMYQTLPTINAQTTQKKFKGPPLHVASPYKFNVAIIMKRL